MLTGSFNTNAGSGLSGFDEKLMDVIPQADIQEGLAVKGKDAQENQEAVEKTVSDWLDEIGY